MKRAAVPSILVVVVLVAVAIIAEAQQPAKVAKIGFLGVRSASRQAPGSEAFRRELIKLGNVEDKNITLEYRDTEGKLDRLSAVADELVRLGVDVLVTAGTPAAPALKHATRTIPIVFTSVGDPVAGGLVCSPPPPGGKHHGVN